MTEKISEFRRRMDDGSTLVLVPHKAESAVKDSEGQTITLTYATKAELQPVKDVADNAVRKDTSASQTMNGDLIVNGHSLSRAVIANLDGQEMTNKVMKSNNRPQLSLQGNAGVYVDLQFKNANGEKKITFNSRDLLIGNPSETADSSAIVNKAYVSATDGTTNNLVHNIGNETIYGTKVFDAIDGCVYYHSANTDNSADNIWRKALSLNMPDNANLSLEISSMFNNSDVQDAKIRINKRAGVLGCVVLDSVGSISAMASASNYVAVVDGDVVTLYVKKVRRYTNLFVRPISYNNYGYHLQLPTITYLNSSAVDPSTESHDVIAIGVRPAYRNVE